LLRRTTDWLASEFSIRVLGAVHRGKASQTITRAIAMYQPNLLVIGAHGEHAPRSSATALGATTVKLITQVKVPLLLVRGAENRRSSASWAAVSSSAEQARRIVHWVNVLAAEGDCHVVRAYEVPYLERLKLCGVSVGAIETCSQDAELQLGILAARFDRAHADTTEFQTLQVRHLVGPDNVTVTLGSEHVDPVDDSPRLLGRRANRRPGGAGAPVLRSAHEQQRNFDLCNKFHGRGPQSCSRAPRCMLAVGADDEEVGLVHRDRAGDGLTRLAAVHRPEHTDRELRSEPIRCTPQQ